MVLPSGRQSGDQMADLIARAREQGAVSLADIAVALDASDLPAHAIDGVARMLSSTSRFRGSSSTSKMLTLPGSGPVVAALALISRSILGYRYNQTRSSDSN